MRPIAAIAPYSGNARLHSKGQVAKIAESIRRFGFNNPVLIDASGTIVAGHGRFEAAKLIGLTEVPTIALGHLTDAERRAYTIADNRLALDATWDEEALKRELEAILGSGELDLSIIGLADEEIERLLGNSAAGARDPERTPAPPKLPVSMPGDLWLLGDDRHRLMCGDSTVADEVARLLGGAKPHLLVSDPPYGVEYDPAWRQRAGISSANAATGQVLNDDQADWRAAWRLFPGAVAYVWHGGLHSSDVEASLAACHFKIRAQIIWVKTRPVLSRGNYHWQHEPALYATKSEDDHWRFVPEHEVASYSVLEGKTADWHGGRRQSTVWFIEHTRSDTGHGTQKPVECMRRPIINNSSRGDAVYDPFSGSGTTLIAAEMTGRRCYAMELSPAYVDVGVRRWQEFTGAPALHAETGRTFEQLASARAQ